MADKPTKKQRDEALSEADKVIRGYIKALSQWMDYRDNLQTASDIGTTPPTTPPPQPPGR